MRILDVDNDKSIKNITIYLKMDEARELLGDLKNLIEKGNADAHAHVNDSEYEHEITVVIYDENDLRTLNNRSKNLIYRDI